MDQTTLENLEKRVAAIEKCLEQILQPPGQPPQPPAQSLQWKDWRLAVGKFRATELSAEIDAAGREIREADCRESAS
jgi:hypothetical protein